MTLAGFPACLSCCFRVELWEPACEQTGKCAAQVQRSCRGGSLKKSADKGRCAQEIVFIGAGMNEEAICKQMDGALLTEEELQKYNQKWNVQFQ